MLTRLYIDNFRCFENFEYKPGPKQLILGANGSGKSSLVDALTKLRDFVTGTSTVGKVFRAGDRTRWSKQTQMRFEVDGAFGGDRYLYKLTVDIALQPPAVVSEVLSINEIEILRFDGRWAEFTPLGSDDRTMSTGYPLEPDWSAVGKFPFGVVDRSEGIKAFRDWLDAVECFRINPFAIKTRTERGSPRPVRSLVNFASWYRHVKPLQPDRNRAFLDDLRESIDHFEGLAFVEAGAGVQLLIAEFRGEGGVLLGFRFSELSEGQRCLIGLYAILHFVVGAGLTAFIDEPENFIGLREMQPWLIGLMMAVEDHGGQAILISHHPEFLDQWAPSYGQRFRRKGSGAVEIAAIEGDGLSTTSELIARGWDDD